MKKFNQKPMAFLIKLSVFCIFLSLLSIQANAQIDPPTVRLEFTNLHEFDSVSPYGAMVDINIASYVDTNTDNYPFATPYTFSTGEYYNLILTETTEPAGGFVSYNYYFSVSDVTTNYYTYMGSVAVYSIDYPNNFYILFDFSPNPSAGSWGSCTTVMAEPIW